MEEKKKKKHNGLLASSELFTSKYSNIANWVLDGWIELGADEYNKSFVRAFDIGGMVWEGKRKYKSIEDALNDLDNGISDWMKKNG